ncbi:MAG: tetratricopeptide repeat protein [Leptolyngbya sp. IPPAS B-1204]|nr:tetratricopeptide repeat protein [Elainella sp. C42_A2020_010]RNJ69618.1 MAG: tetratricopeptide repeat protein [Leptolyngbya sp. IPPAS B-1204]
MSQFSVGRFAMAASKARQALGLALVLAASLHVTTTAGLAQARSATAQEGYILLERGWVNDAIAAFRQALRTNPDAIDARLGLAIAYQRAGQDGEAWNAYQQVIAQEPNNSTALTAIGELASYRPEWQQTGITALTTLLTLQPNNQTARAQRALLYGYQGRFPEAIADYEPVLSSNPPAAVVLAAAQIYTYSGDVQTGLALFERYQASGAAIPNSAITAYALALRQTEQPDLAVQVLSERLERLSSSDPLAAELRSALAVAYIANNQPQQALTSLEPLRNQPNAELPLARAFSAIGRQTEDEAMYREAIVLYQQALQQSSPAPGLLSEAADVLSEMPETRATALQLYQQVLAEQPQDRSVQIKARWMAYQLGELPRRRFQQEIQQLVQPLPSSAAEQQQLAQALVRINPPDPALLATYEALRSPNVAFLQFRIAQIQLSRGDIAAARSALAAYRQTVSGKADPAGELLLAEIERQEGKLEESANRYQDLAQRYANRATGKAALRGLAGIRLAQGRRADALKIYQQIQATYPDDRAIPLGVTAIAYEQGQISAAEATAVLNNWLAASSSEFPPELFLLVGALPADPGRESLYDILLELEPNHIAVNRRWVQLWAGRDPDRAQNRVNQLLAENPDRIEVYFVQGELAQALGDLERASQAYEAILAQQPDQIDAVAALAGVRFQQRRYAEAETLYRQVLTQRPDDADIQRVLAELKIVQDQPVAATQQLRQLQQEQPNASTEESLRRLQTQFLRRRGFQPEWERYR